MLVDQRGQPSDVLLSYRIPFASKLLEYGVHIDRVPEYDDVDDKPQCPELILLAFAIALTQLAAFPVENCTRQAMAAFAAIQLQERRAAFAFVVNVPQDMPLPFRVQSSSLGRLRMSKRCACSTASSFFAITAARGAAVRLPQCGWVWMHVFITNHEQHSLTVKACACPMLVRKHRERPGRSLLVIKPAAATFPDPAKQGNGLTSG